MVRVVRYRVFRVAMLLAPLASTWSACSSSTDHPTTTRSSGDSGAIEADVDAASEDSTFTGRDSAVDSAHDASRNARVDATTDADASEPAPPLACTACLKANCGIPYRVCETDPGCRHLLGCAFGVNSACDSVDRCLVDARTYTESIACFEGGAGDAGARDYLMPLQQCGSGSCASVCPPSADAKKVATCESSFDAKEPQVARECADSRACLCARCGQPLNDCFAEDACTQILGCLIPSGCIGSDCLFACQAFESTVGGPTSASIAAEVCMTRECPPCRPTDGGP